MKALAIIFTSAIALCSCVKTPKPISYINPDIPVITDTIVKAMTSDSIKFLALGDSYTSGQSVPQAQSFPYQLTAMLSAGGFKTHAPDVIAVTGWTTTDLIDGILSTEPHAKNYDFVTLLIGVNDQHDGFAQDDYRVNFKILLDSAIMYAKDDTSRVFVLSIPDYGVTPYAAGEDHVIGPQIDQFNAINKQISIAAGVHYLDVTGISREAATQPALLASDGLHPSGLMYAQWIKLLAPMVAARLNKK